MSGMLEMYEQLIGRMLKQLPTPSPKTAASAGRGAAAATAAAASDAAMGAGGDVRKQLSYILKKVQDLRKHHYHEQNQFLEGLQALRHIPVEALRMTYSGFVRFTVKLMERLWRAYRFLLEVLKIVHVGLQVELKENVFERFK